MLNYVAGQRTPTSRKELIDVCGLSYINAILHSINDLNLTDNSLSAVFSYNQAIQTSTRLHDLPKKATAQIELRKHACRETVIQFVCIDFTVNSHEYSFQDDGKKTSFLSKSFPLCNTDMMSIFHSTVSIISDRLINHGLDQTVLS